MTVVRSRSLEILLVEDNPGDVRLMREALSDGLRSNVLSVVTDGAAALAFLRREGTFHAAPQPDVILLDLNLPKMDGRQVLAAIKGDSRLRRIPVVVLTTSADERDVLGSYDLGANCYITKPVDLDQFLAAVRAIEQFWLTVVTLPGA